MTVVWNEIRLSAPARWTEMQRAAGTERSLAAVLLGVLDDEGMVIVETCELF